MAKNYTLAEAAKIIAEGKDLTAIAELGKRFSLLTVSLASIAALAGDNFTSFVSKFPENITANKVNGWLKNSANVSDDDSDEDEDSTDATDATDEEDEDEKDLDSMTTKELKSLARKMKVFKNAKSSKKEDLIAAIEAANGTASKAKAKTKVEDDEDEDEEETSNPYEGKSAMELFKECKERGIKAAPKKPAKYYVDLLVKADADSADDDEDWDDEEEEPAPKKSTSKKAAKKETTKKPIKQTKKPEPEPAEDEDEDGDGDDWDI